MVDRGRFKPCQLIYDGTVGLQHKHCYTFSSDINVCGYYIVAVSGGDGSSENVVQTVFSAFCPTFDCAFFHSVIRFLLKVIRVHCVPM